MAKVASGEPFEIDAVAIERSPEGRPSSLSLSGAGSGSDVVVYTAIFGGYDELRAQPPADDADFVCFTDDETISAHPWSISVDEPRHPHPRLAAKWYKVFPQAALGRYRYSIWIDGSVSLKSTGSVAQLLSALDERGLALFPHPDRSDVYEEARISARMTKYEGSSVVEQVEAYRAEGLPPEHGLFAGTVLVRDHSVPAVRRLGAGWWREIRRWTYQDQLSLPYVLWKNGIRPALISGNLWSNPLLERNIGHRPFEAL